MNSEDAIDRIYDIVDAWNHGKKPANEALIEIQEVLDGWEEK